MKLMLRFFGFLFAAGTILFVVGVAAASGLLWHFSKDLPDYSQLQDYEPPVMTRVQAADGGVSRNLGPLVAPLDPGPGRWGCRGGQLYLRFVLENEHRRFGRLLRDHRLIDAWRQRPFFDDRPDQKEGEGGIKGGS